MPSAITSYTSSELRLHSWISQQRRCPSLTPLGKELHSFFGFRSFPFLTLLSNKWLLPDLTDTWPIGPLSPRGGRFQRWPTESLPSPGSFHPCPVKVALNYQQSIRGSVLFLGLKHEIHSSPFLSVPLSFALRKASG